MEEYTEELMKDRTLKTTSKYKLWLQKLNKITEGTIGKTMIKNGRKKVDSQELKILRTERREAKNKFAHAKADEKETRKDEYIEKQKEVREQIKVEQTANIQQKLEKDLAFSRSFQKSIQKCIHTSFKKFQPRQFRENL